jgi:uncharacterized membrane protein
MQMGSQLEDRLEALEARLSDIENYLVMPQKQAAGKKAASPQKWKSVPVAVETKPGNWLGIIAIICFVLAAGFIIKLSIESGWLTPERQIGLAALLGLTLVAVGLALRRFDREYASYLPGAGIIILYLTVFAANRLYGLISFEAALGLTGLVSGVCVWLYDKIRHDVYPITAAIGSYVAPLILGLHAQAIFSIYYFLICSIAFTIISIWTSSRILTLVSAYLALVMTALVGLDLHDDELIAGILGLHFFIFSFGTYFYTYANDTPLKPKEAWSFLPVLLIFYSAEYFFIDRLQTGLAPWVSLGFAAVLVGLYLLARKMLRGKAQASRPVVLAYAAIVAFHSIYLQLLPHDAKPWLFVAIMALLTAASRKLVGKQSGDTFYIPVITMVAIAAIEYLSMVHHLLEQYNSSWLLVSFAAVAGMWVALIMGDPTYFKRRDGGFTLLGAAHLLAILALYRLTTDISSLAVSACWLFYAVGVMLLAIARKDEIMAKSALAVLGFSAAKALLYDAASAPTVVRIFCLLLTGAVLYGCGLFMRKVTVWEKSKAR